MGEYISKDIIVAIIGAAAIIVAVIIPIAFHRKKESSKPLLDIKMKTGFEGTLYINTKKGKERRRRKNG
jgi:hypothetical protein